MKGIAKAKFHEFQTSDIVPSNSYMMNWHHRTSKVHATKTMHDLNSQCRISGGFMRYWTLNYFAANNEKMFHKTLWKFFGFFKLIMAIRIAKILSLFKDPHYADLSIHLYLGTFAKFMGGPIHFTELIGFLWCLSESMMYLFCICRHKSNFNWLIIFVYLNKTNIPSKIYLKWMHICLTLFFSIDLPFEMTLDFLGLSLANIKRLQNRARFAFYLSSQYISQITAGFPLIITLTFYLNYSTYNFLVFGLPWVAVWTLWTYSGCRVVYWLPSYYFVYCYYLKLKIKTVNQRLERLVFINQRQTILLNRRGQASRMDYHRWNNVKLYVVPIEEV